MEATQWTQEDEGLYSYSDVPAQEVIRKIEDVLISLLQALAQGESPRLHILHPRLNAKSSLQTGTFSLNSQANLQSILSLKSRRSGPTLARVVRVLDVVYRLLTTGQKVTKRELFYLHQSVFGTQRCSDSVINLVSALLQVPRTCLNILSNTRGLMAGPIAYTEAGVDVVVGRRLVRIPEALDHISHFDLLCPSILIVEKEAVAQRLLEEDFCSSHNFLLVTGAGYPDYPTRCFLKRLTAEYPQVGVWIVTDADPHGIEIMTVYIFGSKSLAGEGGNLALPTALWLGVHPSEIQGRGGLNINERERAKAGALRELEQLSRAEQGSRFAQWREEVEYLLVSGLKFEIEALYMEEGQNLTQYISDKLDQGLWL